MLKRKIKLGGFFFLLGILFFYLEVVLWVPYFRGAERSYPHWLYLDFGDQPGEAFKTILKNPFLLFKSNVFEFRKNKKFNIFILPFFVFAILL